MSEEKPQSHVTKDAPAERADEETAKEAYFRLFRESPDFDFKIRFSRKFKPYNANIRKKDSLLTFSLSSEWQMVNKEIIIGLMQELLVRILKKKTSSTMNIDLYNNFVHNLDMIARKTTKDPLLFQLFKKINKEHFDDLLDTPSLKWGITSRKTLANYDYKTDTINVSTLFKDADEDVISYLLYHEMLHKKLKFSRSPRRTIHHSAEFRKLEKKFPNSDFMEERLSEHLRKKIKKKPLHWLFAKLK